GEPRWYARGARSGSAGRRAVDAAAPVLDLARRQPALDQPAPRRHQRQLQDLPEQVRIEHAGGQQPRQAPERPGGAGPFQQHQGVACAGAARLDHAVVPAGAAGVLYLARHVGYAEAVVELPAGLAALADLQHGRAQREPVAEADRVLVQAAAAQVLAEGAGRVEHGPVAELGAPRGVVVEGIVVHRLVRAAVHARIALLVAGDAERADFHRAWPRRLGDGAPAARARVGHGLAGQDRLDDDGHRRDAAHASAFSRYSASSAWRGVSSSGSIPASASATAEEGANRPYCCGASSTSGDSAGRSAGAWCSSSARRARAWRRTAFGRPASAATCRPKLRLAGPSLTACMNTRPSPCSTASRCTLAMPLPGVASAVSSK